MTTSTHGSTTSIDQKRDQESESWALEMELVRDGTETTKQSTLAKHSQKILARGLKSLYDHVRQAHYRKVLKSILTHELRERH